VLPRVEVRGLELELRHESRLRYEAVAPLGEGGVGVVVKATDHDIGRPVALKRLRPEQQAPAAIVRFVDEIRTVGQLEHPNIVPIHDVGIDANGEYFFVMKYVDGETIESIIDRLSRGDPDAHRRFPFERRVEIFRSVLDAVRYAHAAGILHRDIKPANVMVGRYGEVVVMDWGIAKRVHEPAAPALDAARATALPPGGAADPAGVAGAVATLPRRSLSRPAVGSQGVVALQTQLGAVLGTPAYMSPEQARGEPLDVRSDVYSLCLLFHELLCLRHPLSEKQTIAEVLAGVISEPVPVAGLVRSAHQPPVPMDLSWFLRKGLQKDRAKRYQSVDEMIERLQLRSRGIIPIECHLTFVKRVTGFWIRLSERFPLGFSLFFLLLVVAAIASVVRFIV
jgi:serine/threonine-protein kinase